MSDVAIRVEGLGKRYRLGAQQEPYHSLRDSLAGVGRRLLPRSKDARAARRPEFWALRDVSFEVKHGEVLGIIGRNGAGKSTLLKLLSEITEPTEGRIAMNGRVASLLEVGTGFHPELSGRENIRLNGAILGMARTDVSSKFDEIVSFAGVEQFIDTQVKHYSSGMYLRLAFAVAAHLEPDILVVDEVLAVGDIAFQEKCLGKMSEVSRSGRTIVFVSHSMESMLRLCSRGLLLEQGSTGASGSIQDVVSTYLYRSHSHVGTLMRMREAKRDMSSFFVESIELLTLEGVPLPIVCTADAVRVRISYYAPQPVREGSVTFQISSTGGAILTQCQTQPDRTVRVEIKAGTNQIDCVFPRLLLSAGRYIIGAGIAIPKREWLCKSLEDWELTISPKDIYRSGSPPTADRYFVPQDHDWQFLA